MMISKLLHVNLLGLDISVGLSKKSTDNNQQTDLAIITIEIHPSNFHAMKMDF